MRARACLVGLSCAVLLVAITWLSASVQCTLTAYAIGISAIAAVFVALMILLRRKPLPACSALGLAVGTLLSLALAHQLPHGTGRRHAVAPSTSSVALSEVMSVDQDTRFDVVLVFPEQTSALALEDFIQRILKRVHVQSCVHELPCLARLLRLSQLGPARSEVIAFDLMGDTPQFERAALLSAAQRHALKPALFYSTSALAAARISSLKM